MRREKAEVRAEGLAEALTPLRQSILEVVKARFDPPVSYYQRIEEAPK